MKSLQSYARFHSDMLVRLIWVVMLISIAFLFGVVIAANAEDRPLIWSTISEAPTLDLKAETLDSDALVTDAESAAAEEGDDVPTVESK